MVILKIYFKVVWISNAIYFSLFVIGLEMFFSIRKFSQLGCQVKVNTNKAIRNLSHVSPDSSFELFSDYSISVATVIMIGYGLAWLRLSKRYLVLCPFRQKNLNWSGHALKRLEIVVVKMTQN